MAKDPVTPAPAPAALTAEENYDIAFKAYSSLCVQGAVVCPPGYQDFKDQVLREAARQLVEARVALARDVARRQVKP